MAATVKQQYRQEGLAGPFGWPVFAAAGAAATAAFIRAGHQAPWWPLLAAAAAAGALVLTSRLSKPPTPTRTAHYRLGCVAAAGVWATWVTYRGWSIPAVIVLAVAALFGGLVAVAFHPDPEDPDVPTVAPAGTPAMVAEAAIIGRVCGIQPPPKVELAEKWPDPDGQGSTGQTWHIEFPEGSGYTWTTVRENTHALGGAFRLPPGCIPSAHPSPQHQGAALLKMPKRIGNLAQDLPFPDRLWRTPCLMKDPVCLGLAQDYTELMVDIYQNMGIVGGKRGSGKTVQLHSVTAQKAAAVDLHIVHVDLNGAKLPGPWIIPFAEHRTDRPFLDMAAHTPETALLAAKILVAIAKDRNRRAPRLLRGKNSDILPISPDLPGYLVIVDEGGEMAGDDANKTALEAAALFRELLRIGRAVCMGVIFSSQRGTSDYFPSQIKKAAGWMAVGQVEDNAELANFFESTKNVKEEDLIYQGSFAVKANGTMQVIKGYRLMPALIDEIVMETTRYRPRRDPAAIAAGGVEYERFWQHPDNVAWLEGLAGGDVPPLTTADQVETPSLLPPAVAAVAQGMTDAADAVGAALKLVQTGGDTPDNSSPEDDPDWMKEGLRWINSLPEASEPGTGQPAASTATASPATVMTREQRHELIVQFVTDHAASGVRTGQIEAHIRPQTGIDRRQTIAEDLAALEKAGRVRKTRYATWVPGDVSDDGS